MKRSITPHLPRFHSLLLTLATVFLLFFIFSSICVRAEGRGNVQSLDSIVQNNNNYALKLLNSGKYEECEELLKQTLKIKENPISYVLLSHMGNIEHNFDDAIKYGNLAVALNPNFVPPYSELFNAYYQAKQWTEALALIEKTEEMHISGFSPEQKETIVIAIETQKLSHTITLIFVLAIAAVFFIKIRNDLKSGQGDLTPVAMPRFTEAFAIGGLVSCVLYVLFFAFSKWIWSFNPHYKVSEYAPNMRISIFDHDGIESFVLYVLMLANVGLTLVLMPALQKIKTNNSAYLAVVLGLLLISGYYFYNVGFYPPIPGVSENGLLLAAAILTITVGIYLLYQKITWVAKGIIFIIISFAGLISAGPASLFDLMFILDPALRMVHGFKVSEIYFQYDLFLSFIAFGWMKMNLALDWFPYVGQVSYFLFFIAAFLFADRFFKTKGLSVLFIIALVIMRFYSVWGDVPTIMQTTPIRLDLWIILLIIIYKKGPYHWLMGAFLGLLVLFHRNLGLIYLCSYSELLVLLFLLDLFPRGKDKRFSIKSLPDVFMKHIRAGAVNILIIFASVTLCFVLFHELFSKSASLYRTLGIGMNTISDVSFYWYVPVFMSCLISLLYYYGEKLSNRYATTSLFIVFLLIGNSIYFFGRSHENNILNDSAILTLALFALFDLIIFLAPTTAIVLMGKPIAKPQPRQPMKQKGKLSEKLQEIKVAEAAPHDAAISFTWKRFALALPFLFVVLAGYYYSDRITSKTQTQFENLGKMQVSYHFTPIPLDTTAVREITHNSQNVYFLDYFFDFYHYYYGHYTPQGYFSPCATWVFKKDVSKFLQELLDKGYYLVYKNGDFGYFNEYFPGLDYNQSSQRNDMVAISRQNVPLLLPASPSSLYHIAIKDSLSYAGIDYSRLVVKNTFTIELVLKPVGAQLTSAVILNNESRNQGLKGFTLQHNGMTGDQYGFGYSNGTTLASTFFPLEANKWHYLVIAVSKDGAKVYDNGDLLSTSASTGLPMVNSDVPLTIGNEDSRTNKFTGFIREVKISDGVPDDAEIKSNAQKLSTEYFTTH